MVVWLPFFSWYLGACSERVGEFGPSIQVPPFSVRSLELEMLERGIVCLVSGALALVFPVTVMCCPGFPGCFPESRPWVPSLGAVVVRHSLSVMSRVGYRSQFNQYGTGIGT